MSQAMVDHLHYDGHTTRAYGDLANVILNHGGDINILRPWVNRLRRVPGGDLVPVDSYYNRLVENSKGEMEEVSIITNTEATLRKLDWEQLDVAVIKVAKPRLRAFGDLRAAGLEYVLPNGIAKSVLEYQTQSDVTPATISMDGLRTSDSDRPVYTLAFLPIPIIHKDFQFSARQIMASRTGYSPLDMNMAELSARRVAEQAEGILLGVLPAFQHGGGTVYGFTNFPQRLTYTITRYTAGGYTPYNTLLDVLNMRQISQQHYHYGPWMVYFGVDWDAVLDSDYKALNTQPITLRNRLRMIDGILDVRTVDYQPANTILMVQYTSDVVRAVIGMDITTIQWQSQGGLQLNFKVMASLVPQIRADYNNNTGLVHGS